MAPVPVLSLLHSAVSLFEIQAHNKNVSLVVHDNTNAASDPLYICVDHGKMTQVLRNLISNAIKFTPENGQVQIVASENLGKRGPSVVIRVTDSGAGMTKAQMKKLFKHVVQFNANKLQGGGGSGIGLWYTYIQTCLESIILNFRVSKKIVDLHSGQIQVTSEGLGRGSTFEVELPLFLPSVEHPYIFSGNRVFPLQEIPSSHASNPHMIKISSRGPIYSCNVLDNCAEAEEFAHMHVLVVDDSRINRKFLTRLLDTGSVSFDDADDGMAAIAKVADSERSIAARKFDVILMDVRTLAFLTLPKYLYRKRCRTWTG